MTETPILIEPKRQLSPVPTWISGLLLILYLTALTSCQAKDSPIPTPLPTLDIIYLSECGDPRLSWEAGDGNTNIRIVSPTEVEPSLDANYKWIKGGTEDGGPIAALVADPRPIAELAQTIIGKPETVIGCLTSLPQKSELRLTDSKPQQPTQKPTEVPQNKPTSTPTLIPLPDPEQACKTALTNTHPGATIIYEPAWSTHQTIGQCVQSQLTGANVKVITTEDGIRLCCAIDYPANRLYLPEIKPNQINGVADPNHPGAWLGTYALYALKTYYANPDSNQKYDQYPAVAKYINHLEKSGTPPEAIASLIQLGNQYVATILSNETLSTALATEITTNSQAGISIQYNQDGTMLPYLSRNNKQ